MSGNKFGGERLESKSDLSKNNVIEHLARYAMVSGNTEYVCLDIGCGAGHGSSLLAKKFKHVHGVDISEDAIDYAKANWPSTNIDFQIGSGTNIPFSDNFFDTATAFEVFEHIENWQDFLTELKRVVKPGGLIYISTPNKDIYSPGTSRPSNPHHFFEMTETEFRAALTKYFQITNFLGQRTPIYNDHWIWKIANPIMSLIRPITGYAFINTLKLKIINWIKPNLEFSDVVFVNNELVSKSRFFVSICKNNK